MRKCAICGKGSIMAGKRKLLRGHYNLTKTERKYPNLQWVRLPAGQAGLPTALKARYAGKQRVSASTECIRTLQKVKK